jgi:hypothetical protein
MGARYIYRHCDGVTFLRGELCTSDGHRGHDSPGGATCAGLTIRKPVTWKPHIVSAGRNASPVRYEADRPLPVG